MPSIMDLVLRVMGDSAQFREDMEQDKVILEDFINSVNDINIDVNLEDADAKAKLDEFKAELDELHKKTENINLDDANAKARLDEFKLKLDALRNAHVNIDLNDEHAKEQLDAFKIKWDELRNQALDIRIEDLDAKEKLDALQEKIDRLHDESVRIDIDDADAKVRIDDIKLKLDEIRNAHARIDVDDAEAIIQIDELDKKLDGLEARIQMVNRTPINPGGGPGGDQGGGGGILLGTILTLLPSISPLAAVAAAGIGSIGSAFAAAGAGAVGFGVVAKSNISAVITAQGQLKTAQDAVAAAQQQVGQAKTYQQWLVATEAVQKAQQQLAQTQGQVGASMMTAVKALNDFEDSWKKWTESFRPAVLQAFTTGLSIAQKLMTDMTPVINAAAKAINTLLDGMNKDLGSSGAKKFFDDLAKTTGPALIAFGTGAGNIFKGLAGIFEAFVPTLGGLNKGWIDMTANFAKWGQNLGSSKSFQDFLAYVKQETPQVLTLIGNLGKVIMDLLKAMAPGGAVVLQVVNGILGLIDSILKINPLIGQFGVAILQGFGVMKLIGPIIGGVTTAVSWFATTFLGASAEVGASITALSGPIGWIVAAIVAAVVLIVTHWKQISAMAKEVWKDVSQFFTQLGADIEKAWDKLWSYLGGLWTKIVAFFKKWGPEILVAVAPFIGIPLEIWKHWGEIETWFSDMWSRVVNGVVKFGTDIGTEVGKIGKSIGDYFTNLAKDALSWGSNVVHMIAQGIENAATSVVNAAKKVASSISNFLGFHSPAKEGPGADADKWMPNLMNMLVDGIEAGTPKVRSALSQVIIPTGASSLMGGSGSMSHSFTYIHQQNAPMYGVDDLNDAIQAGVKTGISQFVGSVKTRGRATGISL